MGGEGEWRELGWGKGREGKRLLSGDDLGPGKVEKGGLTQFWFLEGFNISGREYKDYNNRSRLK